MKLSTKIEITVEGHPTDPNRVGVNVKVEGSFPDLVEILTKAMHAHKLVHSMVEAADEAFHDPEVRKMIDESGGELIVIKDEVKEIKPN